MRLKTLIIGAAAMISAPVAASNAQYNFGSQTDVCGGINFTFCFAITATQNANNFLLTITNQALHGSTAGGYGSIVFTALGFNGYSTAPAFTSSPGTAFTASNDINSLNNFAGVWVGSTADSPPPKMGLLFGESITFTFENTTAATFRESDFAIHAQAGPGGCSSKLSVDLSQSAPTNLADDTDCSPVTATPEPASMALMATGLASLGAAARRRRKKA